MRAWKTLSSEDVYETPWIKVRRDQVVTHTGKELTYSVVETGPSVFIFALNARGELYTIKNYRYTHNKTFLEVPAGFCDGQDPLTAATRELMEEAGLASDDWTELATPHQAVSIAHIESTFFLARNVYPAKGERDEEEAISDGKFMSFSEIDMLAKDGKIQEMPFLAGLYLAKLHGV